jgi:hypothetical protein
MAELSNRDDAIREAKNAFKDFWNVASSEFPQNMKLSFNDFYAFMLQRDEDSIVDFGKSVYRLNHTWGWNSATSTEAMQELARKNQGQVSQYDDGYPRLSDFYDALLGKFNSWPVSRIVSAAGGVAKDTASDVTTIATTAVGGYLGITALVSLAGIVLVIMSFKKR